MKQSLNPGFDTRGQHIYLNLGFWDAFIVYFLQWPFPLHAPVRGSPAGIVHGLAVVDANQNLVAGLEGGLVTTVPKGTGDFRFH